MIKTSITLEEIIQNEALLGEIRKIFFPLIKNGIITGYNIYASYYFSQEFPYVLHYLHSDLTKRHKHYKELTVILEAEGLLTKITRITDRLMNTSELIDRVADYSTRPGWKDPMQIRYFTFNGIEVSKRAAKRIGEVIAEGKQYDLIIKASNEDEVKELKKIFKKRAAKYKIDKFGRIVMDAVQEPVQNKNTIYNAWEIPLLFVTSKTHCKPKSLTDFLKVKQFYITYPVHERISVVINTLVRSKADEFRHFLVETNLEFKELKGYALRIFVDDYID